MKYIDKYRKCENVKEIFEAVKQDVLSLDGDPYRVKLKAIERAMNEAIAERKQNEIDWHR